MVYVYTFYALLEGITPPCLRKDLITINKFLWSGRDSNSGLTVYLMMRYLAEPCEPTFLHHYFLDL